MNDGCNQVSSTFENSCDADDSEQDITVAGPSITQLPSPLEGDNGDIAFAVIRNIPQEFHSKDLRYYFAEFVDNGFFRCFHFRHRPEVQISSRRIKHGTSCDGSSCCCLVSFNNIELRKKFKDTFHGQFWMDIRGNQLRTRCYIFNVKLDDKTETDDELLTKKDLSTMIEFRPPSVMPFGNVGTPSEYFLEQIRLCKLPSSLIGKLGLRPAKRIGKYGAVPFNYLPNSATSPNEGFMKNDKVEAVEFSTLKKAHLAEPFAVEDNGTDNHCNTKKEEKTVAADDESDVGDNDGIDDDVDDGDNDGNDDGDECEEWDRHEALHDDITEQDRTKPRKYEEEIEVVWEKGGPGLVWYTDTFYWNETEQGTDTDWKWADDWDVDYSIYYDKPSCSFDAKQAVEIRRDEKLRNGEVVESVFQTRHAKTRKRRYSDSGTDILSFGCFEKYTKGIGSKLLKRYGWKPGKGLGRYGTGKVSTASLEIEEAGHSQFSGQRIGFGYHGEKIIRTGFNKVEHHHITTVYDIERGKEDPAFAVEKHLDPVLRSKPPSQMKYR